MAKRTDRVSNKRKKAKTMRILSNKRVREIVAREAANYLIALDALDRARENDLLTTAMYADAVGHLSDNAANIAKLAGGLDGMNELDKIVKSKMKH